MIYAYVINNVVESIISTATPPVGTEWVEYLDTADISIGADARHFNSPSGTPITATEAIAAGLIAAPGTEERAIWTGKKWVIIPDYSSGEYYDKVTGKRVYVKPGVIVYQDQYARYPVPTQYGEFFYYDSLGGPDGINGWYFDIDRYKIVKKQEVVDIYNKFFFRGIIWVETDPPNPDKTWYVKMEPGDIAAMAAESDALRANDIDPPYEWRMANNGRIGFVTPAEYRAFMKHVHNESRSRMKDRDDRMHNIDLAADKAAIDLIIDQIPSEVKNVVI